MEDNKTLATPQDANVNSEEDTLATTPEEGNVVEDENTYDKVWEENVEEENIFNQEDVGSNVEETETEQDTTNGVLITKPLKHKGREIYVKSEDEAIVLMQKGLDYEFKMSRIKPFRQAIDIIEKTGLEPADIKALADIKEGKQEALEYLANKYNIKLADDDYDFEDDFFEEDNKKEKQKYEPEVEQKQDNPVIDFWNEFSKTYPKESGKVLDTYNQMEEGFQQEIMSDVNLFKAFVGSVLSGEFDEVYPETVKLKALNPSISWIDAYVSIASNIVKPQQEQKEPTTAVQKKQTKKRTVVNKYDDYDKVWDDNVSLEELEKQIFKE